MTTIRIGYCGCKPSETDHTYGTGLTWTPGQVHDVPLETWARMAKHTDVWFEVPQEPEPVSAPAPGLSAAPAKKAKK